jgi:hypothetical protein
MKANAPEKLYLFENPISGTPDDRWLSKRSDDNDIEYTRTDAFIEKACEWLSKHAKKYYFNKEGRYLGTDELVEDFKLSMELSLT